MCCGYQKRDGSRAGSCRKGLESVIDADTVSLEGGQTALPKGADDVIILPCSLPQDDTQEGNFSEAQILRPPLGCLCMPTQSASFAHETVELPQKLTQALRLYRGDPPWTAGDSGIDPLPRIKC
jgi:hypothetical protein